MSEHLTSAQAAERLGVSVSTVKVMIRDGRLRAVKFGRDWLIAPADLPGATLLPRGWPKGKPRKSP
jgi:excisionase family DNA binding protein